MYCNNTANCRCFRICFACSAHFPSLFCFAFFCVWLGTFFVCFSLVFLSCHSHSPLPLPSPHPSSIHPSQRCKKPNSQRSRSHPLLDPTLFLSPLRPPRFFCPFLSCLFLFFLEISITTTKANNDPKQQQNTKPPKLANLPVNQESASCPNNNSSSSSSSSRSNQLCQQPLPQQRANRCCPRCQPPQQRRQAAATPPPPQSQRPQLLPAPQ